MKKILISVVTILLVAALAAGGWLLYQRTTPEYALAQTIADVKRSGVDGLEGHLTQQASQKVDAITALSDNAVVSGLMSILSQSDQVSQLAADLVEKLSQVEWTVEDVLRGKEEADVVLGFAYEEEFSGTLRITMIREDGQWLIDTIDLPQVDF